MKGLVKHIILFFINLYQIFHPKSSTPKVEYSITGQKVATLVNSFTPAGYHNVIFDGSRFGSGIYLYSFQAEGFRKTGKIMMVK